MMRQHIVAEAQALEQRGEGVRMEYQGRERKSVITRMQDNSL
jgi:hypothetical protein